MAMALGIVILVNICGYPNIQRKSTRGQDVIAYQENIHHQLYGLDGLGDEQRLLAMIHFHPRICSYALGSSSKDVSKDEYKWRVPIEVGKQCGLKNSDRFKTAETWIGSLAQLSLLHLLKVILQMLYLKSRRQKESMMNAYLP